MKVTGYKLREAIKRWELRRDVAHQVFEDSIKKFKDETKDPHAAMAKFVAAEDAIAKLQTAQTFYNLNQTVQLSNGSSIQLEEAVKRVGGAGRAEKMWRAAASPVRDRYSRYGEDVRRADEDHAVATLPPEEAAEEVAKAGAFAAELRTAIAVANAAELEILWLDASLLQ